MQRGRSWVAAVLTRVELAVLGASGERLRKLAQSSGRLETGTVPVPPDAGRQAWRQASSGRCDAGLCTTGSTKVSATVTTDAGPSAIHISGPV